MNREVIVLDHAGEGLVVLFGFWRFVCSATYRLRKIEEWRQTGDSWGGRLAVASEIVAAVLIGLGVPGAIVLLLAC